MNGESRQGGPHPGLPPQAGEGAKRGTALLLPPLAGEGRDGGTPPSPLPPEVPHEPIRTALDATCEPLDPATRARLASARRAAVAAATRAPHRRIFTWPTAALVASLALFLGLRDPAPALPPPAIGVAEYAQDLVVVTEDDAALAEDLEFYAWLDAQSQGE